MSLGYLTIFSGSIKIHLGIGLIVQGEINGFVLMEPLQLEQLLKERGIPIGVSKHQIPTVLLVMA